MSISTVPPHGEIARVFDDLSLLDSLPCSAFVCNATGQIFRCSPEFRQWVIQAGYDTDSLNILELGYPGKLAALLRALDGNVPTSISLEINDSETQSKSKTFKISRLYVQEHYCLIGIGIVSNEPEVDIRRSERRLALAVSATADAIWERNLLTDETYYSPRWYEMLGYRDQQFPMNHHTWKQLCHPEDLRPTLDCIQTTLNSQQSSGYEAEYRMRAADGSWVWILGRGNVVERAADGKPLLLSGTNTNVTERKRAEEALAENEHRFRLMIQNFNDLLLILDTEGNERFVSPACERILGYLPKELIGRSLYSFIHVDDVTRVSETVRNLLFGEGSTAVVEFRHAHRDGSYLWLEASGTNLVDDPAIGGFVMVVRDITRRRQSERETTEWKNRYDLLALAAGNVLYEYAFAAGNVVWGGSFKQMLGYESNEMAGGLTEWHERVHPDDRDRVERHFRQCVSNGAIFRAEYRFQARDGAYILVEDTGYPYFDDKGKIERCIGIMADITARRKAEEENARLAESLRQAQKMESIGRLAGGVAHDFNNLLTVISGNVSLATMDLQPSDPLYESMSEVLKAVESAANLTRQLLAFSRKQVIDPKVLNLNAVVDHLLKLLRRLLGEDIELCTVLASDLGQVRLDPGQAEQVMVNLAVNARDAMPDGGVLTVTTANVSLDENYRAKYGEVEPGEYVMLAITDTGCGLNQEVQRHLFEPFFTTKEQGKGTGLGLAMVYGAVTQHKGTIEVETEWGAGATFRILLPRVDEQPETLGASTNIQLPRGSESIFLVEDDDMVRDLAVRLLKRQGYKIYAFPNGGEALMAVAGIEDTVHLLITDVVMPGVNGRVLSENLRALRPTIKVLFTSGYSGDVIVQHGVLDKGIEFLAKPYSLEQLAKRVREVLNK
jgi:two-component system, cell cycle sensor histidine kinase and response regulator CckA